MSKLKIFDFFNTMRQPNSIVCECCISYFVCLFENLCSTKVIVQKLLSLYSYFLNLIKMLCRLSREHLLATTLANFLAQLKTTSITNMGPNVNLF